MSWWSDDMVDEPTTEEGKNKHRLKWPGQRPGSAQCSLCKGRVQTGWKWQSLGDLRWDGASSSLCFYFISYETLYVSVCARSLTYPGLGFDHHVKFHVSDNPAPSWPKLKWSGFSTETIVFTHKRKWSVKCNRVLVVAQHQCQDKIFFLWLLFLLLPSLNKCIGVTVRYILFLVDKEPLQRTSDKAQALSWNMVTNTLLLLLYSIRQLVYQ